MSLYAEKTRPRVLSTKTLVIAFCVHTLFFLLFWLLAFVRFKPEETVIPIDLSVVVNENIDGKEDEPPPLEESKPEPPPPAPKPEPKPLPPPPKVEKAEALEVVKEPPKKKEPKKKEPEKKKKEPEKKKIEPPKKSREELLKERMERMRKSVTTVKTPIVVRDRPSGDGRTAKKTLSDAEVRKLLNQGYVPGKSEQIATSEMQRCASLIQMALNRRWSELSPEIDKEGTVLLEAQFTDAGRLINCRIIESCGSALSDRAALSVASSVGIVFGLSPEFIAKSRKSPVQIRYKVRSSR